MGQDPMIFWYPYTYKIIVERNRLNATISQVVFFQLLLF